MSTGSNLLLLGGAAVAGYLLYENYSTGASGALPADALPVLGAGNVPLQLASGQSATLGAQTLTGPGYIWHGAAESTYYVNAAVPTAAQITAAETTSQPTSTTTGASTTGTQLTTGAPGSTLMGEAANEPLTYAFPPNTSGTANTPGTLAGLWTAIQSLAAIDGNFSGSPLQGSPYHWIYYLTYVWPKAPVGYSGAWPPVLSDLFPSVDLTQPMSASTFWAGLGPYLASAGLSGFLAGLGMYRGMGQVDASGNPCTPGWDAGCQETPYVPPSDIAATYAALTPSTSDTASGYQGLLASLNVTTGTPGSGTNYAPWILGGIAVLGIGVMMAAGGGRR